jgi:hypothetical protein
VSSAKFAASPAPTSFSTATFSKPSLSQLFGTTSRARCATRFSPAAVAPGSFGHHEPTGPEEIRAERARHRSPLLMRCIDDHAAGRRFALDLVQADPTLFEPEVK